MVCPVRVAAARKAPKPNKVEKVVPDTWAGAAQARMDGLLKDAALARTSAITLETMQYASELSGQLMDHATKLEDIYKKVKRAIEKKHGEASFEGLMVEIREREDFGEKAQAHSSKA